MLTQKTQNRTLKRIPLYTLYLPSTPKQRISYFALPGMRGKVNVPIVLNSKYQKDNIINTCSNYFRIPFESLQSKTRMRNVVVARHITMWYLLNQTEMTLTEVGGIFGSRDHTTVIHAKKSVNNSLTSKFDNEYKVHIENLNVIL
jgi:chromosomal replication initiation ATPase DnaA